MPPGEIILRPPTADIAALDGARFGEGGIIRIDTTPLLDPASGVIFNSGEPGLADLIAARGGVADTVALSLFGDSPLTSVSGNGFDNASADLTNPGVRGFYDGVLRLLGWGPAEMPTQVMSVRQVNELRQASLGPDADAITVVIEDPQLADLLRQMDPDAVTMVGNYPAINGERLLATLRQAGAGPGREIMLPMAARLSPQTNEAALRAVEDRAIRMDLLTRVAGPLVREEVVGLSGFTPPTLHEPITSVRLVNPTEPGGDPSGNYRVVVSTREDSNGGVSGGTAARDRLVTEMERMINQGPLPDEFRNWEGMTATRDPNNPGRLIVTRAMDFRGTDGATDHRDVTFFIDVESH